MHGPQLSDSGNNRGCLSYSTLLWGQVQAGETQLRPRCPLSWAAGAPARERSCIGAGGVPRPHDGAGRECGPGMGRHPSGRAARSAPLGGIKRALHVGSVPDAGRLHPAQGAGPPRPAGASAARATPAAPGARLRHRRSAAFQHASPQTLPNAPCCCSSQKRTHSRGWRSDMASRCAGAGCAWTRGQRSGSRPSSGGGRKLGASVEAVSPALLPPQPRPRLRNAQAAGGGRGPWQPREKARMQSACGLPP
jgi:hypothetical protein